MEASYAVTPLAAWLVAGALKFLVNSCRLGRPAFKLIGYGGLPSNHSAIVSSIAALIAFKEGIDQPAFGVAIALAFVVMLDANSLRGQIGKHAAVINRMAASTFAAQSLRERVGHTPIEIAAGILVGIGVAAAIRFSSDWLQRLGF